MSDFISLISRVLMSAVFLVFGYLQFTNIASVINNPGTKRFFALVASGAPAPTWFGYFIPTIQVLGGIAILLGIKTRWVAWAFVLYIILLDAFAHPFWISGEFPDKVNFYKNLAIIGGFLLLAIHGGGRYSVDGRSKTI